MLQPSSKPPEPPTNKLQATRDALNARCDCRSPEVHNSRSDWPTSDGAGSNCSATPRRVKRKAAAAEPALPGRWRGPLEGERRRRFGDGSSVRGNLELALRVE